MELDVNRTTTEVPLFGVDVYGQQETYPRWYVNGEQVSKATHDAVKDEIERLRDALAVVLTATEAGSTSGLLPGMCLNLHGIAAHALGKTT